MDYLSFATNNSSTLQTASNCGNFVVLQQQQQQQQQFQRQLQGYNGFHCLAKNGCCDQNGFRSFSSFETNERIDPRTNRKRSLDNNNRHHQFESDNQFKRKKVSSESEWENKGVDGATVYEHSLERRPLPPIVDSHLLPIECDHRQSWSDDGFSIMDTNGFSTNDHVCYNDLHQELGTVPAYNTSSLEHEKTVDAVLGYDSLYLYNSMIAEMHGC